jgi:polyferredoxin
MIHLEDVTIAKVNNRDLYQPPPRFDLLHAPLLGRLLRWRWGRLLGQIPLLLLALVMIYDGFTGPKIASQNVATVAAWVHYRGLVMLALLLVGNLFCMSCPFTLPRTLARRLSRNGRRWPRVLRNKWLAITILVFFFFLYEWLNLWASPWLTAWIIVGYFLAALVLETVFAESPFCKYVCPLGTFNFVGSTVSPFQITARNAETCHTCPGKECVNGSPQVSGCGTELFVPQIRSNMDCIFCLDCARACPYDNVALSVRQPGHELTQGMWPRRWDFAFLVLVFAFAGISNAFGMVPPFYALEQWLAAQLHIINEGVLLLIIFGVINLLLPVGIGLGAAWLSHRLARKREPLRVALSRYAPAVMPLAFAIWLAHYGFHFATGALAIIPVAQNFLLDHGLIWLGTTPNWRLGAILPGSWLLPVQVLVVLAGFGSSLLVAGEIGRRDFTDPRRAILSMLPWVLVLLGLAVAAIAMFNLPMEMRGTIQLNG